VVGASFTVTHRRILSTWWPLAASWLLMGLEGPLVSAVVARLAEPKVNLAAFGGVVFPIALLIESPIIMMLAASTALCRDRRAYHQLRRYMHWLAGALTLAHALLVFTPLYGIVVEGLIHAPPEVVGPARVGLAIMTPWSWAIAYRRFNQGVLIRFGRSGVVGIGTVVRFGSVASVLAVGYLTHMMPGAVLAAVAIDIGVLAEAAYTRVRVGPVVRGVMPATDTDPLGLRAFLAFYVPLSLTSVISLALSPLGSAALSRMPNALESLAAWPVVTGLGFMFRAPGFAYAEVVVALLDIKGSARRLLRFATVMAVACSGGLLFLTIPFIGDFWLQGVIGLSESLGEIARTSLWIALPLPALAVFQSWYQGVVVHSRRTRIITEAVALSLVGAAAILVGGVAWGGVTGLYVGVAALVVGDSLRTAWLAMRSKAMRQSLIVVGTA
jgi:hypothetical protein